MRRNWYLSGLGGVLAAVGLSGLGAMGQALYPLCWGDSSVRIEVLPSQTLLPWDLETTLNLHIELAAAAPELDAERRLPLNVALVLDRSGSMEGVKLSRAVETAALIVDHLMPEDRFALVSYASDVTVDVRSQDDLDRAELRHLLREIEAGGSTDLFGGLERGVKEVSRHLRPGVNRVFLLSDGLANVGIVDPDRMLDLLAAPLERGVTITAFGMGLDFNEQLLGLLARYGRGHFYFVEEPEALLDALSEELRSVSSIVAREASLELELSAGVELDKVWGHEASFVKGKVHIALPDLAAGQRRKLLVTLRVSPGRTEEQLVARLRLEYFGRDQKRRRLAAPAELRLHRSGNEHDVLGSMVGSVAAEVAYTRTSTAFEAAAGMLQQGNRAEAVNILQEARNSTREACRQYSVEKLCKQAQHLERRLSEVERIESEADSSRIRKNAVLDVESAIAN